MSATDIQTTSELTAAPELLKVIPGRVVVRGSDDYAQTRAKEALKRKLLFERDSFLSKPIRPKQTVRLKPAAEGEY